MVICSLNRPFSGSAYEQELLNYGIQVCELICDGQLDVIRFPKAPLKWWCLYFDFVTNGQ